MKKFSFIAHALVLGILTGCGTNLLKDLSRDLNADPNKPVPPPAPAVYCYNTLGNVTCYDKPQTSQDAGRFVGTSAVAAEPVNPEKQISGETNLPKPEVGDLPTLDVESQKADAPEPSAPSNAVEIKTNSTLLLPHDSAMETTASKPLVMQPVSNNNGVAKPAGLPAQETQALENKPLYDPYLNQFEQTPVDPTVVMPAPLAPVADKAQPIVPPKKDIRKSKSAKKARAKPASKSKQQ